MVSLLKLIFSSQASGEIATGNHAAQCELLLRLSKHPVSAEMEQVWTPLTGPLEENIARFIKDGYLTEASVKEKLDQKFRITDLKQMLEQRGTKAKGKKAELIDMLLSALSPEDASNSVADVRLYRVTEEGTKHIEKYEEKKRIARFTMEQEALFNILKNDVRKAGKIVADYETQQIFARGNGIVWSKGMPEPLIKEAIRLLNFPYDDLPLDTEKRHEFGARLALSVLLGESPAEAGKRLIGFTNGSFDWQQVTALLRPNPCEDSAGNTPEELSELYARTRIWEALAEEDLESLKALHVGKGIRILPINTSKCGVCNCGKYQYEWSELEKLPKLPRQLGCKCTYTAWV